MLYVWFVIAGAFAGAGCQRLAARRADGAEGDFPKTIGTLQGNAPF